MLAELFYPKELKEVIAHLKAEDDLNEKALQTLQCQPKLNLIIWASASVIIGYILYKEFEFSIITILLLSLLLALIFFYIMWLRITQISQGMTVYLNGERRKGIVKKILYKARSPVAKIIIEDTNSSEELSTNYWHEFYSSKRCPKKFEEFYYYVDEKHVHNIMPAQPDIMLRHCLKKSIITEME